MVNQDRNVFAACMVATGDADAMVTGLTRSAAVCLEDIGHVIDPTPGGISFGLTLMLGDRGQTIFIADTLIHERPTPSSSPTSPSGPPPRPGAWGTSRAWPCCPTPPSADPMHSTGNAMRDAVAILDRAAWISSTTGK